MSLYVFSTAVLSIIFMLVFNTWWVGAAPFRIHLSALIIAAITILSCLLVIAVYPLFTTRSATNRKKSSFDNATWASDVSTNLSTPAAVLDGYNLIFANKALLSELGMLGMSDQILGMPITNIIHPGDHQHLAMLFAESAHEAGKMEPRQIRILSLDGTILPAHIALSPLQQDDSSELKLLQFSSTASLKPKVSGQVDQANYHQLINQ
ncbi:MAG: PAS domain-containing protein, partial [Candidatus Methylopumilus sp.]